MPSLANVRTRVDNWLQARWPTVQARQNAYFLAHGKYWQGLKTHNVSPNHLTATFADTIAGLLDGAPTDQAETWMDILPEVNGANAIPAVFIMDVYESPAGHGYVATVVARYNGTIYSRSQNVGPETDRTVAWHVVDESERL